MVKTIYDVGWIHFVITTNTFQRHFLNGQESDRHDP